VIRVKSLDYLKSDIRPPQPEEQTNPIMPIRVKLCGDNVVVMQRGPRPLSPEQIAARLAPRGIKLIGEYRKGTLPATFEGECGHRWRACAGSVIQSKSGCPYCARERSRERTQREYADRLKAAK